MKKENQMRAKLITHTVANELKGARCEDDDLATMDKQFDKIWQAVYGYSPTNLPSQWS